VRPDIGLQAVFRKKKEPTTHRYNRLLDLRPSWGINADGEHAGARSGRIHKAAPRC